MVDSLITKTGGARARKSNTLIRTVLLGTVAVVVGLYWLGGAFGVDRAEMLYYLMASLIFVCIFGGIGVIAGGTLWLVKRFLKK